MIIERAEIQVIKLQLLHPFETSFGVESDRIIPILTLHYEGLEGYSEGVMDPLPLFREETIAGALQLVEEVFLPRIFKIDIRTPQQVWESLSPFRGNRMAKAMIDMAVWDLWAKFLNQPLCSVLGGCRNSIPVGVSLGIQPSLEATKDLVKKHLDQGYKRIKLKIKPGWDVNLVSFIRNEFPEADLTVDANSAYSLADIQLVQQLDNYHLDYIEQPLAFDDIVDHAKLQSQLHTSICLDESILSPEDARKALEIGAGRVINIKVGRVGGHCQAIKVHDVAQSFGAPVWCGGMLESGIGRAHNIHLATLPNFSKPGDTSSNSRYWHLDIINEPLETTNGMMPVPAGAGIGVTLNHKYIDSLSLSKEVIKP
jgi:O-succinylbenzoate synthase